MPELLEPAWTSLGRQGILGPRVHPGPGYVNPTELKAKKTNETITTPPLSEKRRHRHRFADAGLDVTLAISRSRPSDSATPHGLHWRSLRF